MVLRQNNFVDLYNLMLHRAVAQKLRLNRKSVLRVARENLSRWAKNNLAVPEWDVILETRAADDIIEIISQDNDEGQRLRSSSPFAGVLSESEIEKIWSECAEIRPV